MFRSHRDEREKELRRLSKEYQESRQRCRDEGEWVDVEPYQRGWIRFFELREDAKNREDVRHLRQVLDLTNNTKFSRDGKFLERDWRSGQLGPVRQVLGELTEERFEKLDEKMKSYFYRREWYDVNRYTKARSWLIRYFVRPEYAFYFVFLVEPNMVTQEWVPNNECESRYAELKNHIYRNNLWPKISHATSHSMHHKDWRLSPYQKNKRGELFDDSMFEQEEDVA